jgi:cell division protein YceG involved in septum cleavage
MLAFLLGMSISLLLFLPIELQFTLFVCTFIIMFSFLLIELLTPNLEDKDLQILEINQDKNMRCLRVTMLNNKLLEGEDLFKGIYNTLKNNSEFKNSGFQKIIKKRQQQI